MADTANELVSIYIPTRNRVGLLGKAIESVLAQTYRNIELVVVDDGSNDGTRDYLHERAKSDSRLVFTANPAPCGAPASRNSAIMTSRGAFITGLDDDDEFLPERVGAFMEYWKLLTSRDVHPACLYAQDIWLNNGARQRITQKQSSATAGQLLNYNYIGNQIFAPRAHFIEAGLFDEQLPAWQDLDFLIRLLKRHGQAHLLDMPTYLFDASTRPDRISSQEKKIRRAFELVAAKHAGGDPAVQKSLFMQVFQEGYDISPGIADWMRFLGWGGFPKGFLGMARATLPRRRAEARPAPRKPTLAAALPMSPEGIVGSD